MVAPAKLKPLGSSKPKPANPKSTPEDCAAAAEGHTGAAPEADAARGGGILVGVHLGASVSGSSARLAQLHRRVVRIGA